MNRFFAPGLIAAICLAFAVTIQAFGQGIGPLPGGGAGTYGPPTSTKNGHAGFGNGAPPSLNAGCGAGASAVIGTDSSFTFTSGTGSGATCQITPAQPWPKTPICNIHPYTGSNDAYSIGPTGIITLSGVVDSTTYAGICFGQPGGL